MNFDEYLCGCISMSDRNTFTLILPLSCIYLFRQITNKQLIIKKLLQLMTELDQQTKSWLLSLKINKTFSSLADFENGYNFGCIFDKLQLTKGKKFKNSSDLGCIFQNYKNVRDLLLENFGCDFPVNNIIYRTGDLLKVIRDQAIKYVQQKKIMTMKAATSVISNPDKSLIQPHEQKYFKNRQKEINSNSATFFNQTSKMPKKIQDIEKKLDKYRQQKTRHELVALEERKQEIEQYRRVTMNNRDYQMNKVKRLHEEGKEKQRKVYDVWNKTQQIKKHRIETDKQFQAFQKEKRNKLLDTLRKEEVEFITKGQEMFELNCIRQGIQLEHDPDKPLKPEGEFNKVVVMERIKDNIFKHDVDKKQKIKRENKKRIEGEEAKHQSEVLWAEINKIEDYSKKFSSHFNLCETTYKTQKRLQAQKQARKQKQKQKQFVDLPAYQDQQKRQQQFRHRKVQYLQNDVVWMQQRWKKQYSIAEEIVQALLQVTIEGEEIYNKNDGFVYREWKNLENRFLQYQDTRKKKSKDTKLYMDYSAFDNYLKEYIKNTGTWRNFHINQIQSENNEQLTRTVDNLISLSYPDKSAPVSEKVPLYMPLKITLNGARLAGKSTHSAKLAEKYGVIIINPRQLIKEALDLARPPVEEDPKKAAKKQSKKVQELTPEKIALKQFGAKLLQKINSVEQAKVQDLLNAIRFKLQQSFKQKSEEQIVGQYTAAKQKEKSRHEQALKDFEQAQKKPKKEAKKGAAEVAAQQPPKINPCFYSTGFVIDDFTLTEQNLRLLQRQFNGYISEEQRINQQALKIKKQISLVIQIPEPIKDTSLRPGTFDLLVSLTANQQGLIKRKAGRKIDPQTRIIYSSSNPAPDVKGFAEKLVELPAPDDQQIRASEGKYSSEKEKISKFYSPFGVQSARIQSFKEVIQGQEGVQQTFDQITHLIDHLLQAKYEQIERRPPVPKKQVEPPKQSTQEKVQQAQQNNSNENSLQEINISVLINKNLKKQDGTAILNKFLFTIKKYQEKIKQCLYGLDSERGNFMKELMTVQKKFTTLINRPDDKAGKILGFQQNYNKLLLERGSVVKDAEASKHLIQRLNQLYDSLWDAIGAKKNEAVQERAQFKDSMWLNTQSQKIVETLKTLLQIQLNYLCETIFIILILSCKLQNKPSDYVTQYLSLGIAPELEPILSVQKDMRDLTTNQRLSYYINQTNKCLESLPAWVEQKYKKMKINKLPAIETLLSQFIGTSIKKFQTKQQNIRNKVNERVLEQRSYFQALINKMDDWIIQGIKAQNDFVYEIYKNIKKCIEEAKKSNVKQLHVRDITEVLYPIHQLSLHPVPLRVETFHRKIPIYYYMIFLEEIKTLANNDGSINFEIFKKYMDKRKKSELLHPQILKINYETTEQFLVNEGYINLRELALAVILWDVPVFDDDKLARYKEKLLKQERTEEEKQFKKKQTLGQALQLDQSGNSVKRRASVIAAFPTQRKLKLNQLVLMEGAFDEEQEYIMRNFIFEIFRENGSDYVRAQGLLDTLSFFDEIQVYRYGDTVMMLNI